MPAVVADTFVSFLDRNPDESDEFERDIGSIDATALSASGLVTLARLERERHPQRERQLLEQAVALAHGPGREEAIATYYSHLIGIAEYTAAEQLLTRAGSHPNLRTERIAAELEKRFHYDAARNLRKGVPDSAPR